jgi:hypothetical protein
VPLSFSQGSHEPASILHECALHENFEAARFLIDHSRPGPLAGTSIMDHTAISPSEQRPSSRREDGVGVGRPLDIHHGVQRLGRTRGRSVADERHMIPELHSNAPGCLQAGVSQETD